MGLYKFDDGKLHQLLSNDLPEMCLFDVGCSGGIHHSWRVWQNKLSGIGFDMIGSEIERLRLAETNSQFKYVHAIMGSENAKDIIGKSPVDTKSNYPVHRTSGYLATHILDKRNPKKSFSENWNDCTNHQNPPTNAAFANHYDPMSDPYIRYYSRLFSQNHDPKYAQNYSSLDIETKPSELNKPSFLKIDVDGYELEVLKGAEKLLNSGHLLGIEIETQFHGPVSTGGGVFSEIDLLLRKAGFTLFDLELVRHGRSALPRPFAISVPAETIGGPVQWANALYFKDFGDSLFKSKWPEQWANVEKEHLLNLILLMDNFGLQDCAAEIILQNPRILDNDKKTTVLNLLTTRIYDSGISYDKLVTDFGNKPKQFCKPHTFDSRSLASKILKKIGKRIRTKIN